MSYFTENHLEKRKMHRERKLKVSISQFRVKKMIVEVSDLCERVKSVENHMRLDITASSEEFNRNLSAIQEMKIKIENLMKILNDPEVVKVLKENKLKLRKKCERLRRKKLKNKIEKMEKKKYTESVWKEINEQVKRRLAEDDIKRKNEEYKKKMDAVLKDVNKRKTEAKRYLLLIDELKKLRDAREKSTLGRGENLHVSDKQTFITNIEKLKSLWLNAINKYKIEEQNLKELLTKDSEDCTYDMEKNEHNVVSQLPINQWKNVMFGNENSWPQSNTCKSLDRLICIRKQWDQYVCFDEGGSRIPIGWIVPSELSERWKKHVIFFEDGK